MNQQTEQAHQNLRRVLVTGRILVNGLPMTVGEMNDILQSEQLLYQKATQLDEIKVAEKAEKTKK